MNQKLADLFYFGDSLRPSLDKTLYLTTKHSSTTRKDHIVNKVNLQLRRNGNTI